jgi:hypothetical protein
MAITNWQSIQKKLNDALRKKIQKVLTPEEFEKVEFSENRGQLKWSAAKEIQEKILKGIGE